MQTLLNVLILSVTEIVYLFGILIVVGFLLGWIESVSNRWAYQAFGKLGIMLTACIGTPIHEVGHALMCLPSISLNHGDYMQDKESTDRVSVKNSIKWMITTRQ